MATALTLSAPVGYAGTAVQPNGPFVGVNAQIVELGGQN